MGTEIKTHFDFSDMAYLGKAKDFEEKKSSQKNTKPQASAPKTKDDGARKKSAQSGKNTKGAKDKSSAPVAEPDKKSKQKRLKPTGKADSETRKQIRDELIEKVNGYYNSLSADDVEEAPLPEKKKRGAPPKKRADKKSGSAEAAVVEIHSAKSEKKQKEKPVKIIFLGGVGEIGKNMTALEYGNDIIIIDAGLAFPDDDMPGVDLVVPDVTYLTQNKDKIKGIFLTHGHEDHIGGLPYLLKQINPSTKIYATRLTLALADNKIKEHRINGVNMLTQKPGDVVKAGCFEVEFVNVNHSISGAVAFSITTPNGVIYHSGDFKIDLTPVAGDPINLARIAEIGKNGVALYLGESTNIERPGYTMSEKVVGTTFEHLFAENTSRRIIIALFASNVHRLQQIVNIAARYKRKIVLSGRSMLNVVDAAAKIGELTIPEGMIIEPERMKNFDDYELVIISTGTQGEPMSALTRMANGEFNKVTIGSNDTIIISATPIPGNEKMICKVINNLYKKGAKVIYESLEKIHVSGHACQEEHKIIHSLLKPRFFIPIHGEYRHLKRHAMLAEELGMKSDHIIIAEIGNCVELYKDEFKLAGSVPAGITIIDGAGSEDFSESEALKERKLISSEGMFVVSLAVSDGVVVGDPVIRNKGIMASDKDYGKEMLGVVNNALNRADLTNPDAVQAIVEKSLKDYIYRRTKQSPLVMAVIINV